MLAHFADALRTQAGSFVEIFEVEALRQVVLREK
jgi:hypothetical protein